MGGLCGSRGRGANLAFLALLHSCLLLAKTHQYKPARPILRLDVAGCPNGLDAGDSDLNFFVLGDWGRGGSPPQMLVAETMARHADACFRPSFVVSTGDNFYPHGLKGPNDTQFRRTFMEVYTQPPLQVPWYAVLGNHDYGEFSARTAMQGCDRESFSECRDHCCYSATWQDSFGGPTLTGQPSVAARDARWNLRQGVWSKTHPGGVELFMIDSTQFAKGCPKHRGHSCNMAGGLGSQNPGQQLEELRGMLAGSTAKWKLVISHHPIKSYGEHCDLRIKNNDCNRMEFLVPILHEFKVDLYLNGHDHGLQVHKDPHAPLLHYIVTGAGSATSHGRFKKVPSDAREPSSLFLYDRPGFVSISVKGDVLRLDTFGVKSPAPMSTLHLDKQSGSRFESSGVE